MLRVSSWQDSKKNILKIKIWLNLMSIGPFAIWRSKSFQWQILKMPFWIIYVSYFDPLISWQKTKSNYQMTTKFKIKLLFPQLCMQCPPQPKGIGKVSPCACQESFVIKKPTANWEPLLVGVWEVTILISYFSFWLF